RLRRLEDRRLPHGVPGRRRPLTTVGPLPLAEGLGEFVPAHLRPAGKVALLGDLVELGPGFRRRAAPAVALPDGRRLLPERRPRLLGHVGDRPLLPGRGLRLLDVPPGRLGLLLAGHGHLRSCPPPERTHHPAGLTLLAAQGSYDDRRWSGRRR